MQYVTVYKNVFDHVYSFYAVRLGPMSTISFAYILVTFMIIYI